MAGVSLRMAFKRAATGFMVIALWLYGAAGLVVKGLGALGLLVTVHDLGSEQSGTRTALAALLVFPWWIYAIVLLAITGYTIWRFHQLTEVPRFSGTGTGGNEGSAPSSVSGPNLMLAMPGGNVFVPEAPGMQDKTGILLDAKVWNTGAPSVVTEWQLFVIPQNVTPVIAQLTKMPPVLRVEGAVNSFVALESESLERKTRTAPVADMPVDGRLLFYAPLKTAIVLSPETKLKLVAKDVYGKETTVSQRIGDWLHR